MKQAPLRSDSERMSFCDRYFQAVNAEVLHAADGYREYRLPLDVDKELTDRPFFWMWAEKTNQQVQPTTLRLAYHEEAKAREDERLRVIYEQELAKKPPLNPYERMFARPPQTELINLGCFRLNKIQESVQKRGVFASVKPVRANNLTPCIPWLMVNGTIQFISDSIQEEWFSLGGCLSNGQIIPDFFDHVKTVPMKSCPPQELLRSAMRSPQSVLGAIQKQLTENIRTRQHDWASEANERLEDDLSQLDAYYQSMLPDEGADERLAFELEHKRKRHDLVKKSQPRIEVHWKQVAIVGLPLK